MYQPHGKILEMGSGKIFQPKDFTLDIKICQGLFYSPSCAVVCGQSPLYSAMNTFTVVSEIPILVGVMQHAKFCCLNLHM
jgi:hypothetical protein